MKAILVAPIAIVSAYPEKFKESPIRHPDTGLAIITTEIHLNGQELLSGFVQLDADIAKGGYLKKFNEGFLHHPDTSITLR